VTRERFDPEPLFRSREVGFPQAVAVTGGRTLYVSGQVAWDAERRLVGGSDLALQAAQAFRNLGVVLEAAGGAPADVVSLRIYVVRYRPELAAAVGGPFRAFFPAETAPATTWVGVQALADPGLLIEVEAVAVIP